MYAPLILSFILICLTAFYALVQAYSRSCEASPLYEAPTPAGEWVASLEASLGLEEDPISTPISGAYLAMVEVWSSDPTPIAQAHTPIRVRVSACPTYTLRTLAHMCMC